MNKILLYKYLFVLFFLTFMSVNVQAQWAIGIKAGTAGFGGDVTRSLGESLNARVSGTLFSYSTSGTYADDEPSIAYDVDGSVTSIGAVVDYFPFNRGLKLTGGLFYHDLSITGDATPNESYSIDDKTFSPDKLGSLSADIGYKSSIAPYAGIGFGNPVADRSKLKVNFEIGAYYTNSPSVTMTGEGMIGPTARQGQAFEDGLTDFKFYPAINLGLTFRLN